MAVTLKDNALIDATELQLFLQTTITDTDYINTLINLASDLIEQYTDRKFRKATYTEEIYDGNADQMLYLKQAPVTSGSVVVKEWNTYDNVEQFEYTENEDYLVYYTEGRIHLRGHWIKVNQFYRVTYEAGYELTAIPYDLKLACSKICEQIKNQTGKAGYDAETIGQYSVSYSGPDGGKGANSQAGQAGLPIPADVAGILEPYKRYLPYEF